MAKRKRLAGPLASAQAAPETKSFPLGVAPKPARTPIAQVAGDVSAQAAAETLAEELHSARREGRMIIAIPLGQIVEDHIIRDRVSLKDDDLAALVASIKTRGQQTPIEVVDLGDGRFGLISGLRRLTALRQLLADTQEPAFATVQALIRPISSLPSAYVAMVEENEIRADLSFYERGLIAVLAYEKGVFETPQKAVKALYGNATPARRSKIAAFVKLHLLFADVFLHPAEIPEKVGLALVKAAEADEKFVSNLGIRLKKDPSRDVSRERAIIDASLRTPVAAPETFALRAGLKMQVSAGKVVLSGTEVSEALVDQLKQVLKTTP